MHEGVGANRKSHFGALFPQARVHCDNKIKQIGLNHDYDMTFLI